MYLLLAHMYTLLCGLSSFWCTIYVFLACLHLMFANMQKNRSVIGDVLHAFSLGRFLFFISDHKMEFGSLKLSAGMIGLKHFDFYRSGVQLAINTFGYDVLMLFVVIVRRKVYLPVQHNNSMHSYLLYVLLHATLVVLFSCICVFVLRRHLMLWAIFAQKLIFEVSFYAVRVLFVSLF